MDDATTGDFAALLRSLRLARGISQELLAERARLSVQSISSLERGVRRAPYRHTVDALAGALGLDADQRTALALAAERPRGPRTGPAARLAAGGAAFPAYATAFIGRERECAELAELVRRLRLIVVCGFGGVGKTRLAIEVAGRSDAERSTNSVFVDFSSLREPAHVVSRIAAALKLEGAARTSDLDALRTALAPRTLDLVFDNCESVIDECARVVEALVRGCRNVRILCTSREPLRLDGETLYRLEPLDPAAAAIDLLIDRLVTSRAAGGEPPDRGAAAAIVRRLDGIPLAIELAAGLARTRSLEEIITSLAGDEFLTVAERRSTIDHHRTMRAAIAWSYDSLSAEEQTDLRLFAYLRAGMTRAGALALCDRRDDGNLRRLVDTSLVIEDRATGRLRLHEITRQFATALRNERETAAAADRYAHFLGQQMAAAFERGWQDTSSDLLEPFVPLVAELDNVRQAFEHALSTGNAALSLGLATGPDYWTIVGRVPEGTAWLERVRDACGDIDDDPRAAALHFGLTLCAIQSGRPQHAAACAKRAAELAARHGIELISGRALITLGHVALAQGEADSAVERFERAIARFMAIENENGSARSRIFLAFALIETGAADAAERIAFDHEQRLLERFGFVAVSERSFIEILLSEVARLRGDLAGSLAHARKAREAFTGGAITSIHARSVHGLVEVLVLTGQLDEAQRVAASELRAFYERGFQTELGLLLEICALLALRRGEATRAARIAYFADTLLSSAKRTRLRFAAGVHAAVHREIEAALPEHVRTRLREAAGRDRATDVVSLAGADRETYD